MRSGDQDDCDLTDEATYESVRAPSRRGLLRMSAGAGLTAGLGGGLSAAFGAAPAAAATGIVKPLPPEWFIDHGSNAETRWEAMRGQGHLTPADRFFVRNHSATPLIDARTWRLRLWGTGRHRRGPMARGPAVGRAAPRRYHPRGRGHPAARVGR
ncbi:hypothetical protein [Actinomadura sp. B10D3]|uniref:hypothetical protein n=1 Tax=Actinomadura sp. B10D3 TaxID=3153557 RepID=UPI00325E2188